MSCFVGASKAPHPSESSQTLHDTSVTSGVSDEGLDLSQRVNDTIFSGPELDPEVEEVITGVYLPRVAELSPFSFRIRSILLWFFKRPAFDLNILVQLKPIL